MHDLSRPARDTKRLCGCRYTHRGSKNDCGGGGSTRGWEPYAIRVNSTCDSPGQANQERWRSGEPCATVRSNCHAIVLQRQFVARLSHLLRMTRSWSCTFVLLVCGLLTAAGILKADSAFATVRPSSIPAVELPPLCDSGGCDGVVRDKRTPNSAGYPVAVTAQGPRPQISRLLACPGNVTGGQDVLCTYATSCADPTESRYWVFVAPPLAGGGFGPSVQQPGDVCLAAAEAPDPLPFIVAAVADDWKNFGLPGWGMTTQPPTGRVLINVPTRFASNAPTTVCQGT